MTDPRYEQIELDFDIVPTHLAVSAMRDNGYKNAAYAIAELVDNAVQARATEVEILCAEENVELESRRRARIKWIGVLDNGAGMDADVLRIALQFGNGMYLDPEKHTGIGRFGMGLPSSSISQARRVDVWSWQDGVENALHTYIDLDEIKQGSQRSVPAPHHVGVPEPWLSVGESFGQSGTLVVWSQIDRCMWKTANAIIRNSEFLMGRIYRRFIASGQTQIRFVSFNVAEPIASLDAHYAMPNDPIYLMEGTSCPEPFNDKPMFSPYPDEDSYEWSPTIYFQGEEHQVTVRFTIATEQAREGYNPGAKPHGKHAAKNVGVSIMRADRELDLDAAWSDPSEPRDRWWGVELNFPPALDDLFGVTNNKQSARNFSDLANYTLESLLEERDVSTFQELKEQLEEEQDPRLPLFEIANRIEQNIAVMRRLLRAQKGKSRRQRHHDKSSPAAQATEATRLRQQQGFKGESDQEEVLPEEERKEQIKKSLVQSGIAETDAEGIAATTIDYGLKYSIEVADLENPSFFSVKSRGGAIIVLLNSNHPAYDHLVEVLEDDVAEDVDSETLQTRLERARDSLELLLMAWARYEDEQPDGDQRNKAQQARWDWGRIAREFLRRD